MENHLEQIGAEFRKLPFSMQERLVDDLMNALESSRIEHVSQENKTNHGIGCPHCKSKNIKAYGKIKDAQRYYCKDCDRQFNEFTGTALAGIHKRDKIGPYLRCMLMGYSIRQIAKELQISPTTAFDWRHKILSGFKNVRPERFEGILESDDVFFRYSEKGAKNFKKRNKKPRKRGENKDNPGIGKEQVAVIVSADRSGNSDMMVSVRGRIRKLDLQEGLGSMVAKVNTLCSDSHRSYGSFAKAHNLEHKQIKASKGQYARDKIYHVQSVNAMVKRFRQWLAPFNGVATKYLQNYAHWFMLFEQIKNSKEKLNEMAKLILTDNTAKSRYKNIPIRHLYFVT